MKPISLVRPSRYSRLRFTMNIGLALVGQQLICTYIRSLKKTVTLLLSSLLPNPVRSKPKTSSAQILANLLTLLFSQFRIKSVLIAPSTVTLSSGATVFILFGCGHHELKLPPLSTDWSYHFVISGRGSRPDLQRETECELARSGWSHEARNL